MTTPTVRTEDDTYDPFGAFDEFVGVGTVVNLHAIITELRRKSPVIEGGLWSHFYNPSEEQPIDAVAFRDMSVYSALSYEAVTRVLRSAGRPFSSQQYANTIGIVMGHSILEMDEPEHAKYRTTLEAAFSRRAMERWERDVVVPVISEHLDRFAGRGSADLVREFTFPYPVHVITGLLALPIEDLPQFHRWAIELISIVQQRLARWLDLGGVRLADGSQLAVANYPAASSEVTSPASPVTDTRARNTASSGVSGSCSSPTSAGCRSATRSCQRTSTSTSHSPTS
jgi:cytochrome P450